MENNLELNEKNMLRGLGAASFASALCFIASILVKTRKCPELLMYVISALSVFPVMFLIFTDSIKNYFVRLISFIVTGAALVFIFIRVGYKAAVMRDIENNLISGNSFKLLIISFIVCAAAALILALIILIINRRSQKYLEYIEKNEKLQQKFSVISIAAVFVCMAVSSMIYG